MDEAEGEVYGNHGNLNMDKDYKISNADHVPEKITLTKATHVATTIIIQPPPTNQSDHLVISYVDGYRGDTKCRDGLNINETCIENSQE